MFANHNRCYEKSSSGVLPGNDAVKLRMTSSMGTLAFFINCLAFEIWSLMCQDLFCNPAKIYSDRSLYEDWESPSVTAVNQGQG
jgi:hypothetical protein